MRRTLTTGAAMMAATFLTLATASTAHAQSPVIGAAFQAGIPMNEFRDTLDRESFGFGLEIGYHFGQVPIEAGLNIGFMTYGSQERKEPWSSTIPDVTLDVETSNNIALAHLYVRLIPQTGVVRPFIDGKAGLNYLFTSTSVQSEGFSENEEIASSTNYDDAAFSYGGGVGALVELWKNDAPDIESGDAAEVLLDVRAGYTFGGEASYLTSTSVKRENGTVSYSPKTSDTDMIDARVGVQVRF